MSVMPAASQTAPNGGACNNARTGTGWNKSDARGAETTFNNVRNRTNARARRVFFKTNRLKFTSTVLNRFADCWGNFICFSVTPCYFTFAVANDDKRGETETTSALDDRRASTYFDDLVLYAAFDVFMSIITVIYSILFYLGFYCRMKRR